MYYKISPALRISFRLENVVECVTFLDFGKDWDFLTIW